MSGASSSGKVAQGADDGRKERRATSGGQRVVTARCSSPSHFNVEESEEVTFGPGFSLDLPARETLDTLLRAISAMYYRPRTKGLERKEVYVDSSYDVTQYSTLDMLLSPLRKPLPLDDWTPKELALFEAGICKYGKDFFKIQKMIKSKTTNQCVEFYYKCWKLSSHYRVWKGLQGEAKEEPQNTRSDTPKTQRSEGSEEKAKGNAPSAKRRRR